MRDCANCFHRKPVLKEDGTWTAECEKWDCEFQSRENMIEKSEDLISRKWLTDAIRNRRTYLSYEDAKDVIDLIDNAPTVELNEMTQDLIDKVNVNVGLAQPIKKERPQGEWLYEEKKISYALFGYYVCSVCNEHYANNTNFCPNCGADMRGDTE